MLHTTKFRDKGTRYQAINFVPNSAVILTGFLDKKL